MDAEARLLYGLRPCACPTSPLSLFGPPGDVHVLQWDPSTEMLVLSAAADAEQAAAAVRRGELDSSLGPYPLKTHDEWVGLSRHLDEAVIRRAGLQCGTFVLAGGIDDDEGLGAAGGAEAVTPFFEGLPRTARWVQTDPRRVWASDRRLGGAGLQGEQLSRFFQVRPHPHAHSVHTHGHSLSHTRGCRLVAAWVHGVRAVAPLPGLGSHMHLPCIFHASPMHLPCFSHASPMHLPCISQDRSEWLEQLLREEYGGGAGAEAQLLGELQPSSNPSPSLSPSPNPSSSPNPSLEPEPQPRTPSLAST